MSLFSAIRLALRMHAGQLRCDGNPSVEHPLSVLQILWRISLDLPPPAYLAGVLHDVLEDSDMTYELLLEVAGSEVAAVVRVLTKDAAYYSAPVAERESLYLDRICASTRIYPYALLVKMVDRLHNLSTAEFLPEYKRKILFEETEKIYLPCLQEHIESGNEKLRETYITCFDYLSAAISKKYMKKEKRACVAH